MEVASCNSQACKMMSSMVEVALLDTLLLVGRSLMMTGTLLKDLIESTGLPTTDRFPINELHRKEKPGPENTDGSDTEDDDEDGVEDQDDEGDEDYSGEEGGEDDEEADPEDDAEANGEGGSDDGEDDDGDDDDGDDEDGDGEDDEEEDEEEEDQPPAKKRK